MIVFPHLVGWITGDSPFGVGGRPRGQSVFWQLIFIEVFIFAILAMSYNLMFGFTGVISFGHALFFGMGGYILGLVLEKTGATSELGLLFGIILGIVVSGVLGFVVGLVSLRLRGVYFAIFTLAVAEMFAIYIGRWPLTSAEDGFVLSNLPTFLNPARDRITYYYLVLIFMVLCFLFIRRLINSPSGTVLLAIRENESRAQAIGYNTLVFKLLSITLAGMLAAVAGMLQVILTKKVGPEILTVSFTVDPLLMTIIGGIGTFSGPVIGASVLHLSERIFNREFVIGAMTINIGENWSLILGVAFILVVMVFPQGIVGTWVKWRAGRKARTE
ncbi:MAG: branched-chain amino acid ABC transporter permease [Anaerolineaceae bacterium]|nr:branched-chain amino acid ABC transporter permease [Anaerolineaceae bacterium]